MNTLQGIVEDIIYRNEENGYSVLAVSTPEGEKTVVGTIFNVNIGEEIHAQGQLTSHPIYGEQFTIEQYHCTIPHEMKAIERYLGSGAIKGIGPSMAAKIVEQFGEDTFRVIEEEPELLERIKGISLKKAQTIATIFYEQRTLRQGIIFLQGYGISITYALKIFQEYKERTYEIVKNNPYKLAEDVYGIGFKMADNIAEQVGVSKDSPQRMMAGIAYILNAATMDGHVFLKHDELVEQAKKILDIQIENLEVILMELQLSGTIIVKQERVYLTNYYNMEQTAAVKLRELSLNPLITKDNWELKIRSIEKEAKIEFDEHQREAIIKAQQSGLLVITGGPGTGKTTTINCIIQLYEEKGLTVALAAPTGRAAKRMTETTGREAKTLHRLLEIAFSKDAHQQHFERNEEYPLECDVLIVDESSMMDITILCHLLKAVPIGMRLILVGDKDQLPSVGPGKVLKDIISCAGYIDVVVLKKIFRQARESDIVMNAHKINQGIQLDLQENKKDFFFIKRSQPQQMIDELITLVKTRLPKFAKCNANEGIQVLTPMRKGLLGVENLNISLQKALNPPTKNKREKEYRGTIFREGDKIMQIRNNYSVEWQIVNAHNFKIDEGTGVFNGDIGTIIDINLFSEQLKVKFDDDRQVTYEFNNLDELELAYAITIHKSQGSEYPVVVIPIFKGPPMLLSRNLLYTAITRAKQYVVLVGMTDVVEMMINNNREVMRNTSLNERILELVSVLQK